ncbi:MAG TPA: pirin family protein [Anaeromyxobacteraceae bacterium]|nr:pirin family protein [Anaeromyxobacteraceae bacterium]
MDPEIELVLLARSVDLPGGLPVRRAIPQRQRRMVGPFVFVDQMGPAAAPPGREFTVLPHPHIGLSTITYLFEGEGLHRDSLATVQPILPGEVNWMTAGRGIVHSERMRAAGSGRMLGVQIWVALPRDREESTPSFDHYGADAVPVLDDAGVTTRLIAGSLFGATSAVKTSSPLFYGEVQMAPGAVLRLPLEYDERAMFVVEGSVAVSQTTLAEGEIAFFQRGVEVLCRADEPTRLLILGGEPLDGPRYISWNFVSSSRDRLKQAASDWRSQRFDRVPGETAWIPLPEDGNAPVNYP